MIYPMLTVYIVMECHPHLGTTIIGVFRWLRDAKAKDSHGRGVMRVNRVSGWTHFSDGWKAETNSDLGYKWYIRKWKVQG